MLFKIRCKIEFKIEFKIKFEIKFEIEIKILKIKLYFFHIYIIAMNNNIILVILLACILFIYGILFNIKNKQTQLIIESFNNVQNIFKEPLKELNNNQQGIYLSRMEPFMLGTWTTNESTVTGNQVNNVMIIAKNEDKNNKTITISNVEYPISFIGEGVVITEKVNDTSILINFLNFTQTTDLRQPFKDIAGLPRGIVYFTGKIQKTYLTYKLLNGSILNNNQNELKRIIENKIFGVNPPPLNYDIFTYKIMVDNYKYPDNMITFTNKTIPYKNIAQWRIDKLKNIYKNKIMFSIKRIYQGANNERVTTQMSQKYNTVPLDENGLRNQITIKKAQEELLLNRITNNFKLVQTEVYYYYVQKTTQDYQYQDKNLLYNNSSNMNLIGNLQSSFTNTISYPDLNSLMNKGNNQYNTKKSTFETPDINKEYTFWIWDANILL